LVGELYLIDRRDSLAMLEDRIVIDPEIRHGKPVIRGTRVPVDIVLGSLAGGMSTVEVAGEYGITREDVLAAIEYAAKIVSDEEVKEYA
jgi:uncharacterized protein (DUF433 family)